MGTIGSIATGSSWPALGEGTAPIRFGPDGVPPLGACGVPLPPPASGLDGSDPLGGPELEPPEGS